MAKKSKERTLLEVEKELDEIFGSGKEKSEINTQEAYNLVKEFMRVANSEIRSLRLKKIHLQARVITLEECNQRLQGEKQNLKNSIEELTDVQKVTVKSMNTKIESLLRFIDAAAQLLDSPPEKGSEDPLDKSLDEIDQPSESEQAKLIEDLLTLVAESLEGLTESDLDRIGLLGDRLNESLQEKMLIQKLYQELGLTVEGATLPGIVDQLLAIKKRAMELEQYQATAYHPLTANGLIAEVVQTLD